jgi:branched-chain amino acid aminotransferase
MHAQDDDLFEDRSFLYGDGLFETLRVADGQTRWLALHQARLERSARALGYPDAAIQAGSEALAALPAQRDGIWRVTVSRPHDAALWGGGPGHVARRWRAYAPLERPALGPLAGYYWPQDPLAEHKSTSYLRGVMARRAALAAGWDDGVMASPDGLAGECSAAAALFVVDGVLRIPPREGILDSVTRRGLLEQLAPRHGLTIHVAPVPIEALARASEIILLNAARGAVAARSWQGRALDSVWAERIDALLNQEMSG